MLIFSHTRAPAAGRPPPARAQYPPQGLDLIRAMNHRLDARGHTRGEFLVPDATVKHDRGNRGVHIRHQARDLQRLVHRRHAEGGGLYRLPRQGFRHRQQPMPIGVRFHDRHDCRMRAKPRRRRVVVAQRGKVYHRFGAGGGLCHRGGSGSRPRRCTIAKAPGAVFAAWPLEHDQNKRGFGMVLT